MISINNVVDINLNIVQQQLPPLSGFSTVLYFIPSDVRIFQDDYTTQVNMRLLTRDNISNLGNIFQDTQGSVLESVRTYFLNGGNNIIVIQPSNFSPEGALDEFTNLIAMARDIRDDFLFVNIDPYLVNSNYGYSATMIAQIAAWCEGTKTPEKIYLNLTSTALTYLDPDTGIIEVQAIDMDFITNLGLENRNVGVQVCTKKVGSRFLCASLLIGAFFSQTDLELTNTINDYNFTPSFLSGVTQSHEEVTQAQYDQLINNPNGTGYYNFIGNISNRIINFGGDFSNNARLALHTGFAVAALERDVSFAALERMIGKQYLTQQGFANVIAAIDNTLQKYRTNGFLQQGARFSGESVKLTYNGRKYDILAKGEMMPQGYVIWGVPVSDISQQDRLSRSFPPLYVILETIVGARVVRIQGEVR